MVAYEESVYAVSPCWLRIYQNRYGVKKSISLHVRLYTHASSVACLYRVDTRFNAWIKEGVHTSPLAPRNQRRETILNILFTLQT